VAAVGAVTRFARILVAFDGSEAARDALATALDLAEDLGSEVEVLCVEGRLPRYAATIGEVEDAEHEGSASAGRALGLAEGMAREEGAEVATARRPGAPSEQIVRHARDVSADLIVMGHRDGFWHRFSQGSTAVKVTHRAPCPVLVVRRAGNRPAPGAR
jgi:nucleotide-binding universal stress UspA family protein